LSNLSNNRDLGRFLGQAFRYLEEELQERKRARFMRLVELGIQNGMSAEEVADYVSELGSRLGVGSARALPSNGNGSRRAIPAYTDTIALGKRG